MKVPTFWRQQYTPGKPFPVDDVQAVSTQFEKVTLQASVQERSGQSVVVMPERDVPAVEPTYSKSVEFLEEPEPDDLDSIKKRHLDRHRKRGASGNLCLHPLIEAVHTAFAEHRPLVLTPDSIWLVISQGFAQHIQLHAEDLRHRLVRHVGRQNLVLAVRDLASEHWPDYIASFSNMIRDASDPVLHETLICDFSTTTPAVRTAIMDAYERYYSFELKCICGIPEITLSGTADDWRRMRDRIEVLATYDLGSWISRLRPIFDEFVRTAEGYPDRDFWKAICKPEATYGGQVITGWIADLFPYLRRPSGLVWNWVLGQQRTNWGVPGGVAPACFPSGLSRVPVKLTDFGTELGTVLLLAGFFGMGQRPDDSALYPIISWAVTNVATRATEPVTVTT